MEMDLGELSKVGRASFLVAVVGVVAPMALGFGAMKIVLHVDFNTALFIGAALTATSVGITARVFGDLRALATTEARVVLGAAVADDVMGLVVLTVVVRLVTEGSVSALSVLGIIGVAVAFLVVGAALGLRLADPIFGFISRFSRGSGTLVAVAFAFALAFARAAAAAKLAPIVGAFVAGLALTRSRQSHEIHRDLAPVGHILIPVFFLQIGTQAEIERFASVHVLRDAGLLLLVAAIGKLISPLGAIGIKGDKPLIGLGMLPRGEVGLIFATLGKSAGVLDDDLYAALLLVVLITTLVTPQLLKLRYAQLRTPVAALDAAGDAEPAGGWLQIVDGSVDLAARPPAVSASGIALTAAVLVAQREPGDELTRWLAAVPDVAKRFRRELLGPLLDVAERGNARSWRFLDVTGVLEAFAPTLARGFTRRRGSDSRAMDPLARYRLASLERVRRLPGDDPVAIEAQRLLHPDRLILGLLLVDALDGLTDRIDAARAVADELALEPEDRADVVALVDDVELMWSAALRTAAFAPEYVVELATHVGALERARALYVATALRHADAERWQRIRLEELYRLLQETLASEAGSHDVVDAQRAQALAIIGDDAAVSDRVLAAPRSYLLRQPPAAIARQAEILRRPVRGSDVHVTLDDLADGDWSVDVVARDRHGLLADVTGVLANHGMSVVEAVVATWPDDVALETFRVRGSKPDAEAIARDIRAAFAQSLTSDPMPDVVVAFDNTASPWHTVCEIEAVDEPGLLHNVAAALSASAVEVLAATISDADGVVYDRFELAGATGHKLTDHQQNDVRRFLAGGVVESRRWFRRSYTVKQT